MEVIVIDNASTDGSVEMLRNEYPGVTLILNSKNVGFGRANNQALPLIHGRFVLLLNTDAFVEADTVVKTIQYMDAHSACGILGVRLVGRRGELQPSCRFFPTPWNIFLNRTGLNHYFRRSTMVDDMTWDHATVRECDWVPGCYFLIRTDVINQIGLFDPRYFLYYEEIDYCFTAKNAGWLVTYFPYTSVVHIGGESAKSAGEITASGSQLESLKIESELLYFRKNYGLISIVLNMFLIVFADIIQIMKDILKLRRLRGHFLNLKHSLLVLNLFFRTRIGKCPTR
jgi:GT2 family glycosyltransferase